MYINTHTIHTGIHTHTHRQKKNAERVGKKKGEKSRKERGVQERKKEKEKEKGQKEKGKKIEENERERGEGKKMKERGGWVQGDREALVLRRAGLHNNARST